VVVTVQPAVRERDRSYDMELVEFSLGIDAFSSHVDQDNVLLLEAEQTLQGVLMLLASSSVVDAEQALGKRTELLFGLGRERSLIESNVVSDVPDAARIHEVKVGASVIQPHLIFSFQFRNELGLSILLLQEFSKGVRTQATVHLVLPFRSQPIALSLSLGGSHRLLNSGVDP